MAYVEDLMEEQARRGHELSYFFSGRYFPYVRGPRLRRRRRATGGVLFEVINSPLYDHGRQPELELSEPRIERLLERVIQEVRPDVMHVQELVGLPSSVLDVARRAGVPAIVTLQDYFPLCSTFRLLDADGRVCLRSEIGKDCVATTAADPREPERMFNATLWYELATRPLLRHLSKDRRERIARSLAQRAVRKDGRTPRDANALAAAFQRRREVNVQRLNRADRLIAMSQRVAEIYSTLGVDAERLQTQQLTLAHIEQLRPRRYEPRSPMTFATLTALESDAKGAGLLLDAMRSLSDAASAGRVRLLVYGRIDPALGEQAERLPGVELHGGYYWPDALDALLEDVDVGIMPSIWEEAYGYAGIEFLAKGIPVIANAIGAMAEYTREGETGWLNRSCSAEELARIMLELSEHPEQVAELNAKLLAARDSIVKPMSRHAEELDAIYDETIRAASGVGPQR